MKTKDLQEPSLHSKRAIRRWYESRTPSQLAKLEHWLHGYLIRISHPRPSSQSQGLEFLRLVASFRQEVAR